MGKKTYINMTLSDKPVEMRKRKLLNHDTSRVFAFAERTKTDLGSVTEMSRDSTNMEHRTEVEGSTWAGVWRS